MNTNTTLHLIFFVHIHSGVNKTTHDQPARLELSPLNNTLVRKGKPVQKPVRDLALHFDRQSGTLFWDLVHVR